MVHLPRCLQIPLLAIPEKEKRAHVCAHVRAYGNCIIAGAGGPRERGSLITPPP